MKILIADDHSLFREGLRQLLQNLDDQMQLLEADNHQQAFAIIQDNQDLDIVMLDLSMPDSDGIASLRKIINHFPLLPVVVLSASENADDMSQVLKAGAMGFISKSESGPVILSAIRLVLSGGIYVPPALVSEQYQQSMAANQHENKLSPRQIDVLRCIVNGKSNKEIARKLELSDATVKSHLREIFRILNVKNRTQAALAAEKLGITD